MFCFEFCRRFGNYCVLLTIGYRLCTLVYIQWVLSISNKCVLSLLLSLRVPFFALFSYGKWFTFTSDTLCRSDVTLVKHIYNIPKISSYKTLIMRTKNRRCNRGGRCAHYKPLLNFRKIFPIRYDFFYALNSERIYMRFGWCTKCK